LFVDLPVSIENTALQVVARRRRGRRREGIGMAQETYQKTPRSILFCCLQKRWPKIQYHEPDRAFVPETGQNLAWDKDKQAWVDTKTGECICPKCSNTTENVLKTIGRSIHVDIGIGGGYTSGHDEHHHGEDRHRTADKVSTDKTKTHTTSPTTTHKAVTSACKCHPCTCAPCTYH